MEKTGLNIDLLLAKKVIHDLYIKKQVHDNIYVSVELQTGM